MTKDQYATIAVFIVMIGFMVLKTLYFPCDCSVQQPHIAFVETNISNERIAPKRLITMIDLGATECIPV